MFKTVLLSGSVVSDMVASAGKRQIHDDDNLLLFLSLVSRLKSTPRKSTLMAVVIENY